MKYRSKPVEIEAFQVGTLPPEWFVSAYNVIRPKEPGHDYYVISTLEGNMRANFGDWIIRGTEGELYPCKDSVFQRKYEEVK